jgi:5-methylcytosine-specific restriction protein B
MFWVRESFANADASGTIVKIGPGKRQRKPGTLMKTSTRQHLPLAPLLYAYTRNGVPSMGELHHLPYLGPRFAAILSATAKFLFPDFLENASASDLSEALVRFYEACVQPPLHVETVRQRAGIVRHALTYLLRGRDPLPVKAAACLEVSGAYHVAGLGPSFWSAILQGLAPSRHPGWTPSVCAGLSRLGLATWRRGDRAEIIYTAIASAYDRIRAQESSLSALQIDHFLTLVAFMRGRNLPRQDALAEQTHGSPISDAIRRERARVPLRERLKERGQALARGQEQMEQALAISDGKGISAALAAADLEGCLRSPLDWGEHAETLTLWVGRLWESDDPYRMLAAFWAAEPLPGAGLWLPAAVMHLRDPQHFAPWGEDIRSAYSALDDSGEEEPPAERYRLFNEGIAWLRQQYQLHPLEIPAIVASLEQEACVPKQSVGTRGQARELLGGFCADTFHFLGELAHNNKREWMERQRDRYRFAVREPLMELCCVLAERYIEPVLHGVHGWRLDTEPRSGRALTSICKNAYGRTQPYNTALWIAFCRRTPLPSPSGGEGRVRGREHAQFFVRLEREGLRYGLRLGRKARKLLPRFRQQVRHHAELLFRALRDRGALHDCRFGPADTSELECSIATADDLRVWSEGRSFEVSRSLSPEDALLSGDELAGEIVLTFDRLLPLYACAVEEDAHAFLIRCLGGTPAGEPYSESDFQRATLLDRGWLERARHLLELKRQLILQGVPGTGKTHVARHLACLLTGGRDERIRMVQFHPAYSYEEFVEGIKVRSVTVNGRSDVTYPVEAGLLCAFAEEASRRPAEPHVLLIDEINRGNLPRIFGELLYLLEYREQSVCLPCSRRHFRLPSNLYLLATMNAADRSVALIDQALRRRFSFLDMPPDAAVLARWLQAHAPAAGACFAERVVKLFERLNARLRADLGPQGQIGHSYFMVPDLDEARLRIIWQHHIRPLLEEHFAAQPARLVSYEIDKLIDDSFHRGERRRRVEASVGGRGE